MRSELPGQKFLVIDPKGSISHVTYVDGSPDRYVSKGLDRHYELGFRYRFSGRFMKDLGAPDQTDALITDLNKKMSLQVMPGKMNISYAGETLFYAGLDRRGNLITVPDHSDDPTYELAHTKHEEEGVSKLFRPIFYSPDPSQAPIELLLNLSYRYGRLADLLRRQDIENAEFYREMKDVIDPVIELVGII